MHHLKSASTSPLDNAQRAFGALASQGTLCGAYVQVLDLPALRASLPPTVSVEELLTHCFLRAAFEDAFSRAHCGLSSHGAWHVLGEALAVLPRDEVSRALALAAHYLARAGCDADVLPRAIPGSAPQAAQPPEATPEPTASAQEPAATAEASE